jgi:protein-S-isoprenylcysteine O-methyltransferase Ste14
MKRLRIGASYALSMTFFFLLVPLAIYRLGAWIDRALAIPEPRLWPVFIQAAAVVVFALGSFLIFWGIHYIRAVGKGHPEEVLGVDLSPTTTQLITTGPFGYTRNPLALGCLLVAEGAQLWLGSLSAIVLAPVLLGALFIILLGVEERGLQRRFGAAYTEYRARVPFLIPRLPRLQR